MSNPLAMPGPFLQVAQSGPAGDAVIHDEQITTPRFLIHRSLDTPFGLGAVNAARLCGKPWFCLNDLWLLSPEQRTAYNRKSQRNGPGHSEYGVPATKTKFERPAEGLRLPLN